MKHVVRFNTPYALSLEDFKTKEASDYDKY